jgi:hypothetical protein
MLISSGYMLFCQILLTKFVMRSVWGRGNVLSKSDGVIASSLKIFMAYRKDKARKKHDKPDIWRGDVRGIQDNHHSLPMIRGITCIVVCCLIMILRKGEWNELTWHSKDHGKTHLNLGMNSLLQEENDVGWNSPPTSITRWVIARVSSWFSFKT